MMDDAAKLKHIHKITKEFLKISEARDWAMFLFYRNSQFMSRPLNVENTPMIDHVAPMLHRAFERRATLDDRMALNQMGFMLSYEYNGKTRYQLTTQTLRALEASYGLPMEAIEKIRINFDWLQRLTGD